ncbi:hypothetical protein Fmac_024241 [Flemingia macrophylla]|uniref:non-specific serine/threonine protein kinase n=1 Tax=Flemingia macrophylla TaxID=520843 RepID=A0ABD1LNT0_9FABA
MEQASPMQPSTILGKYQLTRLLGRGSFAKVYQARSLHDGATVAVKIIDKSKTVDAAMEPRIIREIHAMRRLQHHPNILRIHEVMATKTKIHLVVELAGGGELFSRISRRGRLPEPTARRYFQQLVSALRFCHRHGVAHRDLKPQNLLLDAEGNLKVSDFGLSALPEHLKNGLLHTACGTPAYAAPEILRRSGGYDGSKADAWSCGLILYVLLAGYLPFDDSNIPAMCKKICRRDYNFPDWISKPARFVIYKLLDPNPDTRMGLEALFCNSWFKKSLQPEENAFHWDHTRNTKNNSLVTAFDIISMSSGLDLGSLFETTPDGSRREKRFSSSAAVEVLEEKVKEVGAVLGFKVVEVGKCNRSIPLVKGNVVLVFEVLEIVVHQLVLVAVKVVEGGLEFEEHHWGDWKAKLQDLVISWHNES